MSGEGGSVFTVNMNDGTTRSYFPHVGASRDDFAVVKLSDSGGWMSSKLMQKNKLVLTDLSKGESWCVTTIEDETIVEHKEGAYKSESSIPACFNFIGDRLLVSDTTIREVSMDRPSDVHSIFVSEQGKAGARKPLKLKASDPIYTLIEKAKLSQYEDRLKKFHSPGCLIKTGIPKKNGWNQPEKKGARGLGESRLGGWPDLPDGIAWPIWNDRPMGFLGQINLAEADRVESEIRVPKSGVLYFFVGCSSHTFQRDPFDSDMYMLELMPMEHDNAENAVKVIYANSNSALKRTEYSGDILPELFSPCSVSLKKGALPLPHECTSGYSCLCIEGADVSNYNELLDCLTSKDFENQFLGYPQLIQSTPLEWGPENQSLGRDFFFIPDSDVELAEFSKAASKWGLLLQLTSDNNPDFQWGDAGHLYIFGVVEEMENGDFSRCYLNFEN